MGASAVANPWWRHAAGSSWIGGGVVSDIENPPAFPRDHRHLGHNGMTLRDYFAVHADQPGVSEIVSMAGGETDGFYVMFSAGGTKYKFTEWWNGLPLEDRLELSARVRYAMADAMLAERAKGGPA